MITAPQNPLALHIGQGTVLVQWEAPSSGTPDHYEVETSINENSGYKPHVGGYKVTGLSVTISSLPIQSNVYIRVRAVDVDGSVSPYEQATLGEFSESTFSMDVKSISGSQIPEGARFILSIGNKLVCVSADSEITVP